MLAATSAYRLAAEWPTRMGNFGLQMDYAGFKNFNENKIGLAYARNLGSGTAVGIQFNYYGYRVPGYGDASALNVEGGAIFHFTDQLQGGVHFYNPGGARLGKSTGEKMASSYSMGLGYDPSPNFFAGAELMKEEDRPVNIIAGIQYHFDRSLFVRLGIETETGAVYAGTGIGWKDLRLDLSASYHPQLGFSPGILMLFRF